MIAVMAPSFGRSNVELLFGTQSASVGQGLNDGTSGGGIGLGACFLETDPWTLDGAL
jgi:hypothetical protein